MIQVEPNIHEETIGVLIVSMTQSVVNSGNLRSVAASIPRSDVVSEVRIESESVSAPPSESESVEEAEIVEEIESMSETVSAHISIATDGVTPRQDPRPRVEEVAVPLGAE
jgi:hypothetical protein